MPAEIITMEDCASNYGIFQVPSDSIPNQYYTVTFMGSEQMPHCTCKGFEHRKNCKHIGRVYNEACFYNPQWHEANDNPGIRPIGFTYKQFSGNNCVCGGPMVFVRRAV